MIFPLMKNSLDKRPHFVAFFMHRATLNNTVTEINADRGRGEEGRLIQKLEKNDQ